MFEMSGNAIAKYTSVTCHATWLETGMRNSTVVFPAIPSVTSERVSAETFELRFCIHVVRRVALCKINSLEVCPWSYDLLVVSSRDKYAHSSVVIHTTQQHLTSPDLMLNYSVMFRLWDCFRLTSSSGLGKTLPPCRSPGCNLGSFQYCAFTMERESSMTIGFHGD